MKKLLFLFIGFVFLSSFAIQETLNERIRKAVTPYVESELRIDLKKEENKLQIVRIDTLTEKDRLHIKGQDLLEELQIGYLPFIELQQHAVNQYMLLYKIHPVKNVRDEIDKAVREYSELETKAAPFIQELEEVIAKEKIADDKEFVAYKVSALLHVHTAERTSKTDTLGIIVSKDLQVIKRKDFIKK
ncbi:MULTISPECIES: hypothetical protein [unclassified Myroides]|uniref:hypothetical protein n=1 Tax=unclassified Myroides TaxID=2642485 RepID=UPI003D2F9244